MMSKVAIVRDIPVWPFSEVAQETATCNQLNLLRIIIRRAVGDGTRPLEDVRLELEALSGPRNQFERHDLTNEHRQLDRMKRGEHRAAPHRPEGGATWTLFGYLGAMIDEAVRKNPHLSDDQRAVLLRQISMEFSRAEMERPMARALQAEALRLEEAVQALESLNAIEKRFQDGLPNSATDGVRPPASNDAANTARVKEPQRVPDLPPRSSLPVTSGAGDLGSELQTEFGSSSAVASTHEPLLEPAKPHLASLSFDAPLQVYRQEAALFAEMAGTLDQEIPLTNDGMHVARIDAARVRHKQLRPDVVRTLEVMTRIWIKHVDSEAGTVRSDPKPTSPIIRFLAITLAVLGVDGVESKTLLHLVKRRFKPEMV
jgi:hypothetical protein